MLEAGKATGHTGDVYQAHLQKVANSLNDRLVGVPKSSTLRRQITAMEEGKPVPTATPGTRAARRGSHSEAEAAQEAQNQQDLVGIRAQTTEVKEALKALGAQAASLRSNEASSGRPFGA